MTSTLTRRRLLEGSLAGLVAAVSSGCADRGSGRKVVVVGAGLSGLNASLILERWGFEVQVVEARERVGATAAHAGHQSCQRAFQKTSARECRSHPVNTSVNPGMKEHIVIRLYLFSNGLSSLKRFKNKENCSCDCRQSRPSLPLSCCLGY